MPDPDDAWPFEDAPNLACFTVRSIMNGTAPILYVSRDDDDGAWQMLTSDDCGACAVDRAIRSEADTRHNHVYNKQS